MMKSINRVTLLGRLGSDPIVKTTAGGKLKAHFNLATSETFKNTHNQRVEQTQWHHIVLWGGVADVAAKYLKKGNRIYIEGKLTHRSYTDKQGATQYITEVVGKELILLAKPKENTQPPTNEQQTPSGQ